MDSNYLKSGSGQSIGGIISALPSLNKLNINNNEIKDEGMTSMSDSIGASNLTYIDISQTMITSIPFSLNKLVHLECPHNFINDAGILPLCD